MERDPLRGTGRTTRMLIDAAIHGYSCAIGSGFPVCIICANWHEVDHIADMFIDICAKTATAHASTPHSQAKRIARTKIQVGDAFFEFYSATEQIYSGQLTEGKVFAEVYIDHHASEEERKRT